MSVGSAGGTALWLDHASIQVPELASAVEHLDRVLGLRATVSPAAPERHSRVHLDRSYLEVAARPGGSGWSVSLFFLRFDDPDALGAHLERAGFARHVGTYEGVDGVWDDVAVDAGGVPVPILVRRTAPPEVARDWPPPLAEPHRCGAKTLEQVHVGVPDLAAARGAYARLLGFAEPPARSLDPRSGRRRAEVPTTSGRIVLLEGGDGQVEGIVLGVTSLDATEAVLAGRIEREAGDRVTWLDPEAAFGLALGFVEV